MKDYLVNYSKTEHAESIADSVKDIERMKRNGWRVDEIDGKIPVGFCELCGLPFFDADRFHRDTDGICTCIECPEEPEPPALLPCPFCGGEASYGKKTTRIGDGDPETRHGVNCASCGGKVSSLFGGYTTKEAAAERWNKRDNS